MDVPYIGDRLLIFSSVFAGIQIFFVALRLLTRVQYPKAWGWDDVVILVSLAGQLAIAGASIGSSTPHFEHDRTIIQRADSVVIE